MLLQDNILKSDAMPIEEIVNFFNRVEFRTSLHVEFATSFRSSRFD